MAKEIEWLWPKTIFNMAPSGVRRIWSLTSSHCHLVPNAVYSVHNFIEIGLFFVELWRFHDFQAYVRITTVNPGI